MFNITFQQIEAFLTVARYQNISKAAECLYVSQPTLSKALQRFESGVGFQVFLRSNQGVVLTPQGEYLYEVLESLYNHMDKAIRTAKDLLPEPSKTLRIVAPSSYDAVDDYNQLKQYVREYSHAHPEVTLLEHLCDFRELQRKLEYGEADIAFTHDFAISHIPGIKFRRISKYKMHLAMSAQHPLAVYESLRPDKLNEFTFFAVPHTSEPAAERNVLKRCQKYGITPKKIELVDNFPTLLHRLRERRGVSICARFKDFSSPEIPADIKYIPLSPDDGDVYVVVAWYDERLCKEARDFINNLPVTGPPSY